MLAVPLKETKPLDWSGPLRSYLKNNYSAETLDEHASSIQRLSTTRERVANSSGASESSVDALESYLQMLGEVEPRFPLGEGGLKLTFVWYDALNPKKKLGMSQVAYERASVLFNLGAVLSHQGMVQDRSDITGLKKACAFFSRAAGCFHHISANMLGNELNGPTLTDLSKEGLEMLHNLMLAQAQACFYEKAIRDQHKPAILSKLASQACTWYERAWEYARCSALSPTLDGAWAAHLEFQYRSFGATAQYQYSKVIHQKAEETAQGYGEEIARLALASEICEHAMHCARSAGLPASMLDTVTHLRKVIHQTMDEASENNNKIYMEVIPPTRDLGRPPATPLAKATAPAEEFVSCAEIGAGASPDSLFGGLLPVVMQEAEALYKSRLSHLVETQGKKVADHAEEIKLRLAEAGLPQAVEAGDQSKGLPEAVWLRIDNTVKKRGGINGLRSGIESNEKLSQQLDRTLKEISSKLYEEEKEDTRCRSTWGSMWTITMSAELSLHMRGDVNRYEELLREANASDGVLKEKIRSEGNKLEILSYSRSQLDKLFPSASEVDNNPDVERTREELAVMLVTLGANIQECERLQGLLVDDTSNDSIAKAMIKAPGGAQAVATSQAKTNALIDKEAGKYNGIINEIDKLIDKQPVLLNKVLEKNFKFSKMRNQSEAMLKREGLIAEIDQAIQIYEDLVTFIVEGEKFYHNLQGRIEQLKTTAMDHCYVREIQRKELESELVARSGSGGGASLLNNNSASGPSGGAYPGMGQQQQSTRPSLNRGTSQPFMQPYVAGAAQAYPVAPPGDVGRAYPVNPPSSSGGSSAPPPSYNQAASSNGGGGANAAKIAQMKAALGNTFSDAELEAALAGADNDVNIAINHILENQERQAQQSNGKKRSSKRFGLF